MTLDQVKIFRRPNGEFSVIYFLKQAIPKGMSEDDFIDKETERVKKMKPQYVSWTEFTKSKSEIRDFINANPGCTRRHLKLNPAGNLQFDNTYKTPKEERDLKIQSLKNKLKQAMPSLTNEELNLFT